MRRDYLALVEAAYTQCESDGDWLQGLAESAASILDAGVGVAAFLYAIDDTELLRKGPVGVTGSHSEQLVGLVRNAAELPADQRRQFFTGEPSIQFARDIFARGRTPDFADSLNAHAGDAVAVFGHDPSRRGCIVAAGSPPGVPYAMAPRTRGALKMVAAHLVAGWRLRFKAPSVAALQESDAVFSLSGRLEHVRQSAVTETEPGSLPLAVKRLVAGRQLRREAPERALELWTALVSGEWSLVERVDTDGKRFLVARKNPIGVPAPGALTPRERVVAYYVARGHSLKLVGYEVGLAPATVTELLQSALRKLGLASKGELVALFASRDD